jgi:hypothetical protein
MAFNRRLDSTFPGFGVSVRADSTYLSTGNSMSGTAQQTFTLPTSGTFAVPFTSGRLRVKIYNGGGTTPAVSDLVVNMSDGTNTAYPPQGVYHPNAAQTLSATLWLEWIFDFLFDVSGTSGGGSGTVGQFLTSVGGANSVTLKTTMTGTSPTASLDWELVPLI